MNRETTEVTPRSSSPEDIQAAHLAEKLLRHWDTAMVTFETKHGIEFIPLEDVLRIAALLEPNKRRQPHYRRLVRTERRH